uniref:Uncharacterized protein n=1 Tax=Aquila chrysaetos chrysaetos TaxID=223781 RepID=A0A663DMJ1_AQUCH
MRRCAVPVFPAAFLSLTKASSTGGFALLYPPVNCFISQLQKGSSQVFSHSLSERDLEIGRLRKESEKLKRDHALAAGIVSPELHQKIQQLKEDVDKMKKENREKDNQLAIVSAKVNIPKKGLSNLWSRIRRLFVRTKRSCQDAPEEPWRPRLHVAPCSPAWFFSLNESGLCRRLLLCICSSLLNWQSCIVCIIRIEQWALRVGRLNKPSSRRFQ